MYYLQSSYHYMKPSFFITVDYLTHPTTIQATGRPEAWVVLLTVEHIQWTCSCCINKFPYFDSHCCHTCSKMFKGSPLFTEQSSNILTRQRCLKIWLKHSFLTITLSAHKFNTKNSLFPKHHYTSVSLDFWQPEFLHPKSPTPSFL